MSSVSLLKPLKILMLLTVASSVAACSALTPSAKAPIVLPALPVELACSPDGKLPDGKPCKPVCVYGVTVPDRKINQAETETYWIKDRASLRSCRTGYVTFQNYYEALRSNLNPPEN